MKIIEQIPQELIHFVLVSIFSLLIGLEQRLKTFKEDDKVIFGTDRTYAFTGILGYILYILAPQTLLLYILGYTAIIIFLTIFYIKKIDKTSKFGITASLTLLITYTIPILIATKPLWFAILVVTTLLVLIEMKEQFISFTRKFSDEEFTTLAKFLVISGVVLPLLPNDIISQLIPFSPFKIWLVLVVVSTISYLSYILNKFVFPKSGILLTGLLGGIYSSTATTFILARNSQSATNNHIQYIQAIVIATSMMYIRILILAFMFNQPLANKLILPFIVQFAVAILFVVLFHIINKNQQQHQQQHHTDFNKNPLELKTAFIFALLFIVFGIITNIVFQKFGTLGLNWLAAIIGVTDIDPFLLALFTGHHPIELTDIKTATLIAISSNNLLKMIYSIILGNKKIAKATLISFLIIILAGIVTIIWL